MNLNWVQLHVELWRRHYVQIENSNIFRFFIIMLYDTSLKQCPAKYNTHKIMNLKPNMH